jgi:cytochrome c553
VRRITLDLPLPHGSIIATGLAVTCRSMSRMICIGALVLGTVVGCAASVPVVRPRSPLALSCTGCHQESIDSPEMPGLNRFTPADMALALRQSRDAPLPGSVMARFTAKLSDADIELLSAELGRRSPP